MIFSLSPMPSGLALVCPSQKECCQCILTLRGYRIDECILSVADDFMHSSKATGHTNTMAYVEPLLEG